MRVKILATVVIPDKVLVKGRVLDLEEKLAKMLMVCDCAEAVNVESAAIDEMREKAVMPTKRRR